MHKIKVWDRWIRGFHWLLVACFILTYSSAEDYLDLHVWGAYLLTALLLWRIGWGFIGTEHARFRNFVCDRKTVWAYSQAMWRHQAPATVGHNPLGGWMIVVLLLTLSACVLSGLLLYAMQEFSGPFFPWVDPYYSLFNLEVLESAHEFFTHFVLILIGLHVLGVLLASWQHQENLLKAMFTGYKYR